MTRPENQLAGDNTGVKSSTEVDSLNCTVSITVAPVNRRPVLTPSVTSQLDPVAEDAGFPVGAVGTLVSSLIDSGGALDNFSDADGDLPGVALVGTSLQGGALYYSIDNGTTWADVGVVSPTSARLLYADDSTRLYFKPAPDFSGTISDVITCKAWDRTGGFNNGGRSRHERHYMSRKRYSHKVLIHMLLMLHFLPMTIPTRMSPMGWGLIF